MRLIDADALLKALVRKEPFSDCARVVIAECMEEVRHAPTIEPERKSGKNPDHGYMWICPECGLEVHSDFEKCVRCGYDRERKKGKWIKTGQSFVFPEKFRNYSCSECGYDIEKIKYNFCPYCGADNRGD